MSDEHAQDEGLAPPEQAGGERPDSGQEASIQVYLDSGWYWEDRTLKHPTDRELTIRIDPGTGDWYPTAGIGRVIDRVVKREGRESGLFRDDAYPTVKLSRLMLKEIERAKRSGER
jgi:hypothetical protein